jgi:cytochrome c-type biogenesis protein CcmH
MSTFIVVAALMAAIAAAIVAIPLLRSKRSRMLGVVAAAIVTGAAAGLYPLWSNWDWHSPADMQAAASPDVLAMVAKLEQHLKDEPNDLAGWLMMGRSYMTLERADDAVIAFQHANSLGKNADAALGLGEALSVRAGGEITPQASQLFEEALQLAPDNPKALFYGGFAAALRGDTDLARQRWQALKDLHPPPQIEQMLDARLAELGPDTSPGGNPARDESVAGGDECERRSLGSGPGECQYKHCTSPQSARGRRGPLVRVRARAGWVRAASGRQAIDHRRHRHTSQFVGGRFDDSRPCPEERPEGLDHGAGVLQRPAHAGSRRLVR